jgi:GINS complex protein helical bundle domain
MIEVKSNIEDVDREFENSKVKVVVIRDLHELEIGDRKIGPFKNGEVIEISEWISEILADQGIVKSREQDMLDLGALSKTHWKETIPTSRQLPPLNANFYCELRRLIRRLKKYSKSDTSKLKDYEKAISLSKDIINCRIRKIASLAASQAAGGDMIQGMAKEEKMLYTSMSSMIADWNERLLGAGMLSES